MFSPNLALSQALLYAEFARMQEIQEMQEMHIFISTTRY